MSGMNCTVEDMVGHASDCAMHNMPAYPNGPCDCDFDDFRIGESVAAWEARTGYSGTYHSEALRRLHNQVQRMLAKPHCPECGFRLEDDGTCLNCVWYAKH